MKEWRDLVKRISNTKEKLPIAIVGKYASFHDAYLSIKCALEHAGYAQGRVVDIRWVESELITRENVSDILKGVSGILIPGGFGVRGIEGMINTCEYARINKIPLFSICLGLQVECIELSRNVLGHKDANSFEFNSETSYPVVTYVRGQHKDIDLGGTMRLGNFDCELKDGTLTKSLYGVDMIQERHRHRFEINNKYMPELENVGFIRSGVNPENNLVEIMELKNHPFYIGVQFHPEFKSRPLNPHPLFMGFIKASIENEKAS